ncbi:unnamed protein product [Closterium sp. Naga37s-1]|nr:unnamed protein product [Closterium sp. Naga37s-1]
MPSSRPSTPPFFPLCLSPRLPLTTLPYCTPPLLSASHHSGYWMGHLWQPHACRLRRLSPPALHACFNGRTLLFLGDSQLRYTFGFLRFLLRFPSCAAFLTKFAAKPKPLTAVFCLSPPLLPLHLYPMPPALHSLVTTPLHIPPPYTPFAQVFWPNMLACGSVPRGNGSIYPPINSSTGELISTGVCQQPDSAFFFHGENFNGYGRALYKVKAAAGSPPWAFNLTYVSQCGAVKPVFPAWMSDPALVGLQLTLFDARDDSNLLPLLAVMRDPSAVTVLGPWAAREDSKPPEFIPVSNNARAMAFEAELLRRVPSTQPGAPSALGMMGLTLPRPDLCPDSTHYAWPVTLAILDLWLTPLCAQHASRAPQH